METSRIKQNTILVVDDTIENLLLMCELLEGDYNVTIASNGEKALEIVSSASPPDLILLDIMMPGMDGYEVCRRLKRDPQSSDIPVIFLTGKVGMLDEEKGLKLGAVDYIGKPISPPIFMARVDTHLWLKRSTDLLRNRNAELSREVEKIAGDALAAQEMAILALASLAETRDDATGGHLRRTQRYLELLARELQDHPRFRSFLTESNTLMLSKSAPLHDIGKVGIPDQILNKPGPLTVDEFEIMKTHTLIGREALDKAEKSLGRSADFLDVAKVVALSHHEKWDGSGYPHQLSGDEIPEAARLMALADFYDSLVSNRVYRSAVPHDQVADMIRQARCEHFDPDVADAFLRNQKMFITIFDQIKD
jgi:putative two-component system response regulator